MDIKVEQRNFTRKSAMMDVSKIYLAKRLLKLKNHRPVMGYNSGD
jgi:hypothetical protein